MYDFPYFRYNIKGFIPLKLDYSLTIAYNLGEFKKEVRSCEVSIIPQSGI